MKKIILAASLALFVGQAHAVCTQPGYVPNGWGGCEKVKTYNGSDKSRYGENQGWQGRDTINTPREHAADVYKGERRGSTISK